MTKSDIKIKIELENYLQCERGASFAPMQAKVSSILRELYSSKDNPGAMTGWISLPHNEQIYAEVDSFISKIVSERKYEHLVVLGIGGSSLGAQALIEAVRSPLWNRISKAKRKGYLTADFVDNLDPFVIRMLYSRLKLDRTLFIVISKSGGTLETIVPMLVAKDWAGPDFYKQCVFVTTKGKGLLFDLAQKNSIPLFYIPENVGGRYSVFSPVGLLPAALCGVDLGEIKKGLRSTDELCKEEGVWKNPAISIALSTYFSYKAGKNIFVLMPYSSSLKRFVEWFVQLWSESLGKEGKGSTPLLAIGATDQHSQIQMFNEGPNDKLVSFIKIQNHKRDLTIGDFSSEDSEFSVYVKRKVGKILNMELDATRRALTENGRPNFTIVLPELSEYYLSGLMYIFEFATAIMGRLLEINPFDQPGVELAKRYTKEALSK